jgi:hypothetical protein
MPHPENRSVLPSGRWAPLAGAAWVALVIALLTVGFAVRPALAAAPPAQTQAQGFPEAEEDIEEEWEAEEEESEGDEEEGEEDEEFATEGPLLLPADCLLHSAEAQVTALSDHDVVRLTIHYTSYTPTNVSVDYWLKGGRGSLQLDGAKQHFNQRGVFQEAEHLTDRAMGKVRAARTFVVRLSIPAAPSYCDQYATQRLTVRHKAGDRSTWSRPN